VVVFGEKGCQLFDESTELGCLPTCFFFLAHSQPRTLIRPSAWYERERKARVAGAVWSRFIYLTTCPADPISGLPDLTLAMTPPTMHTTMTTTALPYPNRSLGDVAAGLPEYRGQTEPPPLRNAAMGRARRTVLVL
jgi:hypothetical protein